MVSEPPGVLVVVTLLLGYGGLVTMTPGQEGLGLPRSNAMEAEEVTFKKNYTDSGPAKTCQVNLTDVNDLSRRNISFRCLCI